MGKKLSIADFKTMKAENRRFGMVTCYDYTIASLIEKSDMEAILVGDSLGIVAYGYKTTTPVTLEQMIYALQGVCAGAPSKFIVGDMPFGTYNVSWRQAIRNANRLVKEGGCDCVKVEGGAEIADKIEAIVKSGTPVMGHIGLTPQTAASMGGMEYQGKSLEAVKKLIADIQAIEAAGAFACSVDNVPVKAAEKIAAAADIPLFSGNSGPTGIGYGLNFYDIVGLPCGYSDGGARKYTRNYLQLKDVVIDLMNQFDADVKNGEYPKPEECYSLEVEGMEELWKVVRERRGE